MPKILKGKRGVDVSQIGEMGAVTPAQRVEHVVEVVNVLSAASDQALLARQGEANAVGLIRPCHCSQFANSEGLTPRYAV